MTRLAIVGDIFLTDPLPDESVFANVQTLIQDADIGFGNLEAPVSKRGQPVEKWINMRMAPDRLADVRTAGFDILTIANNHMMDYGLDAFYDTRKLLPEHGLAVVGAGDNLDEAWQPVILTTGEQKVAFLAAASTLGPGLAASEYRPGVAPVHVSEAYNIDFAASMEQPGSAPYVQTRAWPEDVARAEQAVRDAKSRADFVIIAMHWGVPPLWRSRFQDGLADYQPVVGHRLAEAGADLVVGHHPHSLQTIEVYKGTPIFYSLGNFIFHHNRVGMGSTIIARNVPYTIEVGRDRAWAESIILTVELAADGRMTCVMHPILLDSSGNPALLDGVEARSLIERLSQMSPEAEIDFLDGKGHLTL